MKFPLRLAPLFIGTGAVLGTFVACGDNNSNTDDDANGGAGGEGPNIADCTRPGQSWCVDATSGLTCPEGISEAVEFTCDDGDVCNDGECVGECEVGATECDGEDAQRVCTTDGTWATVACQAGQNCHDGSCGLVCVPGMKSCKDDGTSRTCKEDGSGWDEVDCPGESTCSDGACRGSVCIVGAKKCADEVLDLPRYFLENDPYFYYPNVIDPEPALDVIYTCTDGEQWEESPCPSDEDTRSLCAYSDVQPSVVSAYRAQVNLWFADWMNADNESELPEPPDAPELSEFAQAECVVEACTWETAAIYSPSASRQCGTEYRPGWMEMPEGVWGAVSKCEGFFPYAPTKLVTTACEGTTACIEDGGGCVEVECLPGEARCFSSTEYDYCLNDFSFYEAASCPVVDSDGQGGASEAPGTCADTGEAPNRSATCEGEAVEEPILVMAH